MLLSLLKVFLASAFLFVSNQTPYFWHKGNIFKNNSFFYYAEIDEETSLQCVLNGSCDNCAVWRDEEGKEVSEADAGPSFYFSKSDGKIQLFRNNDHTPITSGLWKCDVMNELQNIYIYIGNNQSQSEKCVVCKCVFCHCKKYRITRAGVCDLHASN